MCRAPWFLNATCGAQFYAKAYACMRAYTTHLCNNYNVFTKYQTHFPFINNHNQLLACDGNGRGWHESVGRPGSESVKQLEILLSPLLAVSSRARERNETICSAVHRRR